MSDWKSKRDAATIECVRYSGAYSTVIDRENAFYHFKAGWDAATAELLKHPVILALIREAQDWIDCEERNDADVSSSREALAAFDAFRKEVCGD